MNTSGSQGSPADRGAARRRLACLGQARVGGNTAFDERIARSLDLFELVAERDDRADLVLLAAIDGREQPGRIRRRPLRRGDPKRVAFAGEPADDLAHELHAVGDTARSRLDRRSPIGQRSDVLLHGLCPQLEALELSVQRFRPRAAHDLRHIGGGRNDLRGDLTHSRPRPAGP